MSSTLPVLYFLRIAEQVQVNNLSEPHLLLQGISKCAEPIQGAPNSGQITGAAFRSSTVLAFKLCVTWSLGSAARLLRIGESLQWLRGRAGLAVEGAQHDLCVPGHPWPVQPL
jgi:hypothetical protein